jgi:hypothetical protein
MAVESTINGRGRLGFKRTAAADCCRSGSESRKEIHIANDDEEEGGEEGERAWRTNPAMGPDSRVGRPNLWPCSRHVICRTWSGVALRGRHPDYRLVADDATSSTVPVHESEDDFCASF